MSMSCSQPQGCKKVSIFRIKRGNDFTDWEKFANGTHNEVLVSRVFVPPERENLLWVS